MFYIIYMVYYILAYIYSYLLFNRSLFSICSSK